MKLTPLQRDALAEMANIATSHLATAISQFFNRNFINHVPDFTICKVDDLPSCFHMDVPRIAAVTMQTAGEFESVMLLLMPLDSVMSMVADFLHKQVNPEEPDEEDLAVITEMGNIAICAYLNAVSRVCGKPIVPTAPGVAVDSPEAILEFPACVIGDSRNATYVLSSTLVSRDGRDRAIMMMMPGEMAHLDLVKSFSEKMQTGSASGA